jgi:hypothetical protein
VPQQAFDFYKKVSAFWGVLIEFVLRDEDLKRRRLLADEWRWSVARLAKQTIALPAAWTQEFGEEWKRFGTSDLVTYARQAAATWARIAADLDPTAIPDFLARRGAA